MSESYGLVLFNLMVLGILALDLGVFHRRAHRPSFSEAALWSVVWIGLSGALCVTLYFWRGPHAALEYLTSDILQKSLSLDNVFFFALIFGAMAVSARLQHRVLFWGVIGAVVLRAAFIVGGLALIAHFQWMFYVFGAFLVFTGAKLLAQRKGPAVDPKRNIAVRWAQKVFPVAEDYEGSRFFIKRGGQWHMTRLFIVLAMVEIADLVFALDSIPASFAVSRDPFIVYTSNILALLGLRALYFLVERALTRMRYLTLGLSFVLVFMGLKMLATKFIPIPIWFSLPVICAILGVAMAASVWTGRRRPLHEKAPSSEPSLVPGEQRLGGGGIRDFEGSRGNVRSTLDQQCSRVFHESFHPR
jgi:tellurite resistance protein TerC